MKKKTVIIYAFESSSDECESIGIQIQKMQKYCEQNNLEIIDQYCDGGNIKNLSRPHFQEFLGHLESGLIRPDTLLCVSTQIITGYLEIYVDLLKYLERYEVEIRVTDKGIAKFNLLSDPSKDIDFKK